MPRFYCPLVLKADTSLSLPENVVRHLHVLRLTPGQRIALFNGDGDEFEAILSTVDKRSATVLITAPLQSAAELPYRLTLAQALPEGSKMDWIIEKAVELGAFAIQPLAAQRCVVKLTSERAAKRQQHWQGIVVAASEQCGRSRLAEMRELAELAGWVAQPRPVQTLLLTPRTRQSLASWTAGHTPQDLAIVVGPEGGFNDQEEKLLIEKGALPVAMGPRILRTETAGLAALAVINAAWGQM